VQRWHACLSHRPGLIERLAVEREWRFGVLCQLQVGVDAGARITIPIRNAHRELRGILRYQPWHTSAPKMLAIRGTRLGLIPHPRIETSHDVVLVEGPADMLAARSCGIPAIAVPGAGAWRPQWSELLAGRTITIVMDCDSPGRRAAERIAGDLQGHNKVSVLDIDPSRDDGYDLSDALQERASVGLTLPAISRLPGDRERTHQHMERGIER
jgi:5S rRNA maturation endonuclease (ribonuclease M5)